MKRTYCGALEVVCVGFADFLRLTYLKVLNTDFRMVKFKPEPEESGLRLKSGKYQNITMSHRWRFKILEKNVFMNEILQIESLTFYLISLIKSENDPFHSISTSLIY